MYVTSKGYHVHIYLQGNTTNAAISLENAKGLERRPRILG